VTEAVWEVVDRLPFVVSATISGSFTTSAGLEGISDIDTIVVVDGLDALRFAEMQARFRAGLKPPLADAGYRLVINPTLGPLKFNDPRTAVLHLMLYSVEAHREHVVKSPFTCFDWQRSPVWRKRSLAEVYPTFCVQPHHFLSARRSARDYLRDLFDNVVSYRELAFDADGYREVPRQQPMTLRDRHEFAYHVLRFLMQNFLKLVRRSPEALDGEELLTEYFTAFPEGADVFPAFYRELRRRKRALDFDEGMPDLDGRTVAFAQAFEAQFRAAFEREATRHILLRHAPTALNGGTGDETIFQGRTDPPATDIDPEKLGRLGAAVRALTPARVYTSGLRRTADTLKRLAPLTGGMPAVVIDHRLSEINYGGCEGLTVAETRRLHPELFDGWRRGEDPVFPGGECMAEVRDRVIAFAVERLHGGEGASVACTHNVALRCLVGDLAGVPQHEWHRLRLPHLAPIGLVASRRFGLFLDLDEQVEREVFSPFLYSPEG
jgi:broad specificity phosphatase PhoE